MPTLSCFTGFGFLEFSGAPSECEKVYQALRAGYRSPKDGTPTISTEIGTHQEAKIFAYANAIAAARVTLRRAANELRPETSYELLEKHEAKFGMTPAAGDSVAQRRAALAAKQKLARGPRHEAVQEALSAIYGSLLVDYHPMTTSEAEAFPSAPGAWDSPGLFRRPDAIAKSIRLLRAVTRTNGPINVCAEYNEMNVTGGTSLSQASGAALTAAGQSVTGNGGTVSLASIPLKCIGTPTGNIHAKIYLADTSGGVGTYVPTGTALATSEPLDATLLPSAFYTTFGFDFTDLNQIQLEQGVSYVLVVEYTTGNAGMNEVLWGYDGTSPAGPGNWSGYSVGAWAASTARDFCFHLYTGFAMTIPYENWDPSLNEVRLVKGDVLVVDGGLWGHAERIIVVGADGDGEDRVFTAAFRQPHTNGIHATTGPMPLWSNSKRHVLIVVTAAAAVDVTMTQKTNELFARIMRGPTTWSIVQETTPGSGTTGPFKIGTTLGSPLGCAPVEQVTL